MKTHQSLFSVAVLVALAFSADLQPLQAQDAAGGAVLLKSKLTAGKTYRYRTEMEMEMGSLLGGDDKTTTKMIMDMGMAVGAAGPDGNKVVTTKFDSVKMEMSSMGQEMVYDSTDKTKQNPMLKGAFAGLEDKDFKAIYDENNRFVKMEGGGGGAAGPMGMGMSADQVEQMLQQLTDYGFPAHAVKPGEKWDHTQKTNLGQMGKMEIDMQFTYKGQATHEGNKVAEVDFTGTMGGDAGDAGLVSFKNSTMTGKMFFDAKLGAIRHSKVDMKMTMSIGGAGGAEMDAETSSSQTLLSVE